MKRCFKYFMSIGLVSFYFLKSRTKINSLDEPSKNQIDEISQDFTPSYSSFKNQINLMFKGQTKILGQQSADPQDTHKIVIVTEWRSGSSFLGDIFNMHPDVFYLYE